MTVRRKPKRALANEIADVIRVGGFRPGERLRQIDLEEKFNATRFDIRAALDELVVRKAIEHLPNRGYRVAEVDVAMLRAIRTVRVILETAAAEAVVGNIDAAALARLRVLAERFAAAVHEGTRADQSRVNGEFHRLIYSLCGNPVLEELIWTLRDRSRGSAVTVWSLHEALLRSDRDHQEMLAALETRDAQRFSQIIAAHILKDDP